MSYKLVLISDFLSFPFFLYRGQILHFVDGRLNYFSDLMMEAVSSSETCQFLRDYTVQHLSRQPSSYSSP
jgi:hypothetical protein